MVGATTLGHVGVVSIEGEAGIGELAHGEAAVASGVVPRDEEVELLTGWEDTDGGESLTELSHGDVAAVVDVEDLEGVSQVEVGLQGEVDLLSLDLILSADHVTETIDELILVSDGEDGLARGARVAWERLGGTSAGWRASPVRRGWAERR